MRRRIGFAPTITKAITLLMSAAANAYSMASGADNAIVMAADIAAGISIPALIALATYTLGRAIRN